MPYFQGVCQVNGLPRNGAEARLYAASAFATPPQKDTPFPSAAALGTVTTGPQYGSDGAYRFTISTGEYWVGVNWRGTIAWEYRSYNSMASSQIDITTFGAHSTTEPGYETFDSAPWINAAIANSVASDTSIVPEVLVPPGKWRIDSPILIQRNNGSAWQFVTCTLRGLTMTHEGAPNVAEIIPSFNDNPALIVQFARGVRVKDLVITGKNDLVTNSGFGGTNYDLLLDNSLYVTASCRNNPYSPYCGVAIDPFNASVSSGNYYPGMSTYYGYTGSNNGSSNVEIENVTVRQFVIGYMITSSTTTQQGDVITLRKCRARYNQIGVAIGQSQSRGVEIIGGEYAWQQFFVSCSQFGQRNGPPPKISGGVVCLATKYLFDVDTDLGTLDCAGLYAESTLSIGFLGKDISATCQPSNFNGCEFKLHNSALRPDFHIRNVGPVNFKGCFINTAERPLQVWTLGKAISYQSCQFQLNTVSGGVDHYASANNYVQMESFDTCMMYDKASNGGPTGDFSGISKHKLAFTPTDGSHDHSLLAPGCLTTYQSTVDLHYGEANWGILALTPSSGVAVTADGSGGATFTATTGTDRVRVGDRMHMHSSSGFNPEVTSGGTVYNAQYAYVGTVAAISGSDITLKWCPQSFISGTYDLRLQWMRRYHQASTCDTTSGSTTISDMKQGGMAGNSSWKVGHRIEGTGIAEGTFLVSVDSGAFTAVLSRAATATGGDIRIFDSDVRVLTGTAL